MQGGLRNVKNAMGLTIGDVSAKYNVTFRSLRFYESIGLLSPMRLGTARYYSPEDTVRVELILKGKKLGFSLEEIKSLINAASCVESHTAPVITESLSADRIAEQILQLEKERALLAESIQELNDALAKRSA